MTARLRVVVLGVIASTVMLATCSQGTDLVQVQPERTLPSPRAALVAGGDPVIVAAGDAVCGTGTAVSAPCKHAAVATLITSLNPSAVLLLGDNQYENATLADYNTFYQPTWGVFKSITRPSAGNHEYNTAGAKGYYDYFNGVGVQSGMAGDRSKGYYSFNVGTWHVVSLNSNCSAVGGCGVGSAQEQWLREDLGANATICTLAYWHHPRFSSGSHGNDATMQPLWQALYDAGADLVLSGHDHDYERFAPQTAAGELDATRGLREFVVGTGGKEHAGFGTVRANSEVRNNTSFGVLQLALRPTGYEWQFAPIPGDAAVDAGTAACSPIVAPPPPQTTLTFNASADTYAFKNKASTNYGTQTTLLVDGDPAAKTYFKFSVTGLTGRTIVSAKLRLYAVDPSDAGGRLHRVASTSWSESTLKWSNAPAYDAATIGTIGAVAVNSWYEVDVTAQVLANGTYSFALESTSTNGADYRSREGGATTAPRLVVVVR